MPVLSELERRAWDNRTAADQQPPRRAMLAAADDLEAGVLGKIRHVIVVMVEDIDECDRVTIYQAGDLTTLAIEGALGRAIRMERNY